MGRKKKIKEQLDLTLFTKSGKLRKRKPKTSKNYFTQENEDAIVAYNKSTDERERNKIFNEKIHFALYKLCENIINTFKFWYTGGYTIEELKQDVLTFLLEKLDKYNPEYGKAYSYFGTIAKRWLIVNNKKNYEILKLKGELEEVDDDVFVNVSIKNELYKQDQKIIIDDFVIHMDKNMNNIFSNEDDIKISQIIVDLFKNRYNLEIFNKQSLYLNIKETTGFTTSHITKIVKVMRKEYKKIQNIHFLKGEI